MYGIPPTIDLSFLVAAELAQVCLGLFHVQLRFDRSITIDIEGSFSLDEGPVQQIREGFVLHTFLGQSVSLAHTLPGGGIRLTFSGGASVTLNDSCSSSESYILRAPGLEIIV